MGDRISISISVDSPLNETLIDRGPLALLLRGQYEIPFGINNIVQFSFVHFMSQFMINS